MKFKDLKLIILPFLLVSCANKNEKKTFTRDYNEVEIKYIAEADNPSNYSKEKEKKINESGDLANECKTLFFDLINSNFEYQSTSIAGRCIDWYEIKFYYEKDKCDFIYIKEDCPFPFTNSSILKEEEGDLNLYHTINEQFYWKMMKLIDKLEIELSDTDWHEVGWK